MGGGVAAQCMSCPTALLSADGTDGKEWDPEIRNEVIWADTEEAKKFKPPNPPELLPSGNPFLMYKCPS